MFRDLSAAKLSYKVTNMYVEGELNFLLAELSSKLL